MFSKALFKQSCKANGLMWGIITFAICFMLSCVMCISGSGNVGEVAVGVEDTIIEDEIDAQINKRALSYYGNTTDGLEQFDEFYLVNFNADAVTVSSYSSEVDVWLVSQPQADDYATTAEYVVALDTWKSIFPEPEELVEQAYALSVSTWLENVPAASDYTSIEEYQTALVSWSGEKPSAYEAAGTSAYKESVDQLTQYIYDKAAAIDPSYTQESSEAQEMLGSVMFSLNPQNLFDSVYSDCSEAIPADYDVQNIIINAVQGKGEYYISSDERVEYRRDRAANSSAIFLGYNITKDENVNLMLDALSSYGVTEEKYDSFNYTYANVNHMASTKIVAYQAELDYEISCIDENYASGEYLDEAAYQQAIADKSEELSAELTDSLLASLPSDVSDALEEVGKMDLYSIIVGSVYFKMAGLLLPFIYIIMASNNLIAGQVDSGSMAYVLSTSTKRSKVVRTQALYLILSLVAMVLCTTITSIICLNVVTVPLSNLSVSKLILINLGSLFVMFAVSGINFLTSCWFDRSKKSMSIGGGITMFFLVATMLGLFGSKVIPSIVRFDALNYFNYISIITLFDTISIIDGTNAYIWKFAILLAIGICGYMIGSKRFEKKDLPL